MKYACLPQTIVSLDAVGEPDRSQSSSHPSHGPLFRSSSPATNLHNSPHKLPPSHQQVADKRMYKVTIRYPLNHALVQKQSITSGALSLALPPTVKDDIAI